MKPKTGTYRVEHHYEATQTNVKALLATKGEFQYGLKGVLKGYNSDRPLGIYTLLSYIKITNIKKGKVFLLTPTKSGFEFVEAP